MSDAENSDVDESNSEAILLKLVEERKLRKATEKEVSFLKTRIDDLNKERVKIPLCDEFGIIFEIKDFLDKHQNLFFFDETQFEKLDKALFREGDKPFKMFTNYRRIFQRATEIDFDKASFIELKRKTQAIKLPDEVMASPFVKSFNAIKSSFLRFNPQQTTKAVSYKFDFSLGKILNVFFEKFATSPNKIVEKWVSSFDLLRQRMSDDVLECLNELATQILSCEAVSNLMYVYSWQDTRLLMQEFKEPRTQVAAAPQTGKLELEEKIRDLELKLKNTFDEKGKIEGSLSNCINDIDRLEKESTTLKSLIEELVKAKEENPSDEHQNAALEEAEFQVINLTSENAKLKLELGKNKEALRKSASLIAEVKLKDVEITSLNSAVNILKLEKNSLVDARDKLTADVHGKSEELNKSIGSVSGLTLKLKAAEDKLEEIRVAKVHSNFDEAVGRVAEDKSATAILEAMRLHSIDLENYHNVAAFFQSYLKEKAKLWYFDNEHFLLTKEIADLKETLKLYEHQKLLTEKEQRIKELQVSSPFLELGKQLNEFLFNRLNHLTNSAEESLKILKEKIENTTIAWNKSKEARKASNKPDKKKPAEREQERNASQMPEHRLSTKLSNADVEKYWLPIDEDDLTEAEWLIRVSIKPFLSNDVSMPYHHAMAQGEWQRQKNINWRYNIRRYTV